MNIEHTGAAFFAIAVVHTFICGWIKARSVRMPNGHFFKPILHFLGEIELVFAFWAIVFFTIIVIDSPPLDTLDYVASLNMTEPFFVFVILFVASTRPVLNTVRKFFVIVSSILQRHFRWESWTADFFVLLSLGPLAGSFMTEPAAMTVTALLLRSILKKPSAKVCYFLMAILFVNISIGGALTPFAAPPILMVAKKWNWDFVFIFQHFAWKTLLAIFCNTTLFVIFFKDDLKQESKSLVEVEQNPSAMNMKVPLWLVILHFIFMSLIVVMAHELIALLVLFLIFWGLVRFSKKDQDPLRWRESFLVGCFLAGIVAFGSFQQWWLSPLLKSLTDSSLYLGAIGLTAVTDNAALTYLGSQVEGLAEISKYILVAGAITGGGLTVIANAPNAAGFSLLQELFPDQTVGPGKLFLAALIPTAIAALSFWVFPF